MHTLLRLPLILLELALRRLRLPAAATTPALYAPVERPATARATTRRSSRRRRPARAGPARAPQRAPRRPGARSGAPRPSCSATRRRTSRAATEAVASFGPADDAVPTLHVQAPWDGYDAHPAAEVIKRVRAADEATKAVVLLYEQGHKARASVIRAAGGQRATA